MSTDGNANADAAASPPPPRGFCTTSHDTFCIRCGVSVCRLGVKDVGRHLAAHCRENEKCRLPGNLNLTKVGRALELDMIAKHDQYQRLRKDGCSWFQQKDPTDTHKCTTCMKLFDSASDANRHYKQTRCNDGPPPIPVDCHKTISKVLVEVLPRPLKSRKLDDTFAAAGSTNYADSSSTGKYMYLTVSASHII